MNILIADKVAPEVLERLSTLGSKIDYMPELTDETLISHIQDTQILVVRSTKVKAAAIEAAPKLSIIVRAGAGVNTIDIVKAAERGIAVSNCPGKNNDAVAELAIGLLISADRRIPDATICLRNGQWEKGQFGKARGLKGRTLGIVGLGSIGQAMIKRAKGLDMNVIAWSRSLTSDKAKALGVTYCDSLTSLAAQSDAVSVHLAMSEDTKGIMGKAFFDCMKPNTIFINTSRGEVVDSAALARAIQEKKLRVGLDVFENEPTGSSALFKTPELALLAAAASPHIGASTDQSEEAIGEEVFHIVKNFIETGKAINTVNIRQKSPGTNLVVRHYNKIGVLAALLDLLKSEDINIEEMENTIFASGKAASCVLSLDKMPSETIISEIRASEHIIHVMTFS